MLIYCTDKEYKNELVKKGLHFIKNEIVDGNEVFLFAINNNLKFNELDSSKVFMSNKMRF